MWCSSSPHCCQQNKGLLVPRLGTCSPTYWVAAVAEVQQDRHFLKEGEGVSTKISHLMCGCRPVNVSMYVISENTAHTFVDVFLPENNTGIKCVLVCIFGCRLVHASEQASLFRARKHDIFLGSGFLLHCCTSTQLLEVKPSHIWKERPPWTNERRCRLRKGIPGQAGCSVSCPLTWVALLERTQASCFGQEWNLWVGRRRTLTRGSSIFILVFFWFLKWC